MGTKDKFTKAATYEKVALGESLYSKTDKLLSQPIAWQRNEGNTKTVSFCRRAPDTNAREGELMKLLALLTDAIQLFRYPPTPHAHSFQSYATSFHLRDPPPLPKHIQGTWSPSPASTNLLRKRFQ